MSSRLKVQLPVCPEPSCRQVGKQPTTQSLKNYCTGSASKGTSHKKRSMVPVEFTAPAPKDGEAK